MEQSVENTRFLDSAVPFGFAQGRPSVEESPGLCFVSNPRLEEAEVCHHLFAWDCD
jgi:hypothetical protein